MEGFVDFYTLDWQEGWELSDYYIKEIVSRENCNLSKEFIRVYHRICLYRKGESAWVVKYFAWKSSRRLSKVRLGCIEEFTCKYQRNFIVKEKRKERKSLEKLSKIRFTGQMILMILEF